MIPLRWAKGMVGILCPVLLPLAASVSPVSEENVSRETFVPEKGLFLVATPEMQDPRFRRSVVLLLEHGEEGTLGLIVNKVTEISLSQVLPDLEDSRPLFFGGPVRLDGILFLTRNAKVPERAEQVMKDVYYSGDRSLLEELLSQDRGSAELRVFLGNSGWSPGQLAAEIREGAWKLVPADSRTLFEEALDDLWPDLIGPPTPSPFMVQRPHFTTVPSG